MLATWRLNWVYVSAGSALQRPCLHASEAIDPTGPSRLACCTSMTAPVFPRDSRAWQSIRLIRQPYVPLTPEALRVGRAFPSCY
jgi:hypothetical protein